MKNILSGLCFMILSLATEAQITQEEAFIRKLDQHNAVTLVKNDTTELKTYLAADFLINGSTNKVSFGAERILSIMRSGRVKYVQFDVVTDTVLFLDQNTAISMGNETVVSASEGPLKDHTIGRRYTNFWFKENNRWKLKARHSSIICAN